MKAADPLEPFLNDWVKAGEVSTAAALVGRGAAVAGVSSAGALAGTSRAHPHTRFDLASLTKPITATLALALDSGGWLGLETPVATVFPRARSELRSILLCDLLRHAGGFVPWTPLYARCAHRGEALDLLLQGDLLGASRPTYSDLGYILWGMAAEERLQAPLGEVLERHLLSPLGLDSTAPSPGGLADVASCSLSNAREVELAAEQGFSLDPDPAPPRGIVQDGNARFLGGLAGHAGLFATLHDLFALAREWLHPGRLLREAAVRRALTGTGPYLLGWWRPAEALREPPFLSSEAFGHSGFTGTSLWIDPVQERTCILLAHRSSPNLDLTPRRRHFHRLCYELANKK